MESYDESKDWNKCCGTCIHGIEGKEGAIKIVRCNNEFRVISVDGTICYTYKKKGE